MPSLTISDLPSDLLLEILLKLPSLKDLLNTLLSNRLFLPSYHQRRTLLINQIIFNEIQTSPGGLHNKLAMLQHANKIISRLHHNPIPDSIIVYESILPIISGDAFINTAWKLCELYNTTQTPKEPTQEKKLALLKRAYEHFPAQHYPYFFPDRIDNIQNELDTRTTRALRPARQGLCRELAKEYCAQGRLKEALEIQQSVLERLPITESSGWDADVVGTFRAMGDVEGALKYEKVLYRVARAYRCERAALDWARHIVEEYELAGRMSEAIYHQRQFLGDLRPGSLEYSEWARDLAAMEKRLADIPG